jgi:catechol 2,3-dioxygenase-like lactoylglutathione lyase family enzyme
MLDHVGIDVSNMKISKEFYVPTLKLLDYELITEYEDWLGFALNGKSDFWIHAGVKTSPSVHIAFRASSRALVDKFYQVALAAGGKDNGAPGIRHYPNNYCAYILDPDGHDIEIVCFNE